MNDLKFEWQAGITPDEFSPDGKSLLISGELVNAEVCANNFALDAEELPSVTKQVKDLTLRIDHSKSARDVIGGLKIGNYDSANKRVMFEAEVDDPVFQRLITKGRLKYVSIGATADAFCSKCSQPTRPFRACDCKGAHDIIRNIKLKEASIVTEPAYQTSEFKPQGFTASLAEALIVTPKSPTGDEAGPLKNKILEEKKEMTDEIKATTLSPAGKDAVVLLAEKLEAVTAKLTKMEEDFTKKAKKEEEDEAKKEKSEAAKKEEAVATKFESLMAGITKLEESFNKFKKSEEDEAPEKKETSTGIPKDIPASKFEKKKATTPCDDDADEDDVEDKPVKKEAIKGAKVENAESNATITADGIPPWFKEIKAYAEKNLLD